MGILNYQGTKIYTPSGLRVSGLDIQRSHQSHGRIRDAYFFETLSRLGNGSRKTFFNKERISEGSTGLLLVLGSEDVEGIGIQFPLIGLNPVSSFLREAGCRNRNAAYLLNRRLVEYYQGRFILGLSVKH